MDHFWPLVFSLPLWTPALSSQGEPQLIGSRQWIVVALGGDVVLPCCVEPRINVENQSIYWRRFGVQPDPADPQSENRYVHCYQNNQDEEDLKMVSYAGRTSLFTEDLKHGNASLKITNVKLSDEGWYRCDFMSLMKDTIIGLSVESESDKIQTTETPQTKAPTDETNVEESNSVKTQMTETPQTQAPTDETNVEGGWTHQMLWIPIVVFCVLLILVPGVGFLLKHVKHKPCQKENQPKYDIAPTQSCPV